MLERTMFRDLRRVLTKYTSSLFLTLYFLQELFNYYEDPEKRGQIFVNNKIKIISNLFKEDSLYEGFIKTVKNKEFILFDGDSYWIQPVPTTIIVDYFKKFLPSNRVEIEDLPISTILVNEDFNKEFPETPVSESGWVCLREMKLDDLCVFIDRYDNFKFVLNPRIELGTYFPEATSIQKIQVNVKRKVRLNDLFGTQLVVKWEVKCPHCGEIKKYYPFQTTEQLKHACEDKQKFDKDGNVIPGFTTIQREALKPHFQKTIYMYECKYNKDDVFIYSFEQNLKPGRYIMDIYNTQLAVNGKNETSLCPILLAYKKIEAPQIQNIYLPNNEGVDIWCKNKKLPRIRVLDVMWSVRHAIHKTTNMKLDDRGFLLQYFTCVSALAKQIFNYNKLGISVIGNMSLGKTYPAYLYGVLLDPDFMHIQNSNDASVAGLKGGINNNKLINGQTTTVFEQGKFTTAGLLLVDEGQNFYQDRDLNDALKNFLDKKITIAKIGGESGIEQNYTPIILANFGEFSQKYKKEIKDLYPKFLKKTEQQVAHGNTPEEISNYLDRLNMYLPERLYETEYKNKTLALTISYVRKRFELNNIDWKTGGSIPASYRLLFDVVVWNKQEKSNDLEDRTIGQTKAVLPEYEDLPVEEFSQAIQKAFKTQNIDLRDQKNNTQEVNKQLELLGNSIDEWFRSNEKGIKTFYYLSKGTREIDPKLNSIVYAYISTLQLLEDINSIELSENIKEWAYITLIKCKRGITEKEYNFNELIQEVEDMDFDFDSYDNFIKEEEKMNELELKLKAEMKLMEQKGVPSTPATSGETQISEEIDDLLK